ncbi:MAG: CAAX prenyl protease-related protein [Kiritimatiellae bacterium]|nr:CAAX prenyl protease-related protein [Kiritimatiellia bacterium]
MAWLLVMTFSGGPSPYAYAFRTLFTTALLIYLRPWRWYPSLKTAHILPAVAVGLAVFVLWVIGESEIASRFPYIQELYLRWGMTPFGDLPNDTIVNSVYAPEACGWTFTIIRIVGSFAVVAIAEEFFWRGCLYRILIDRDFLNVDLNRFKPLAFTIVCVAFGFEHQRWLVGILAGAAYGGLMIKTRSLWAPALAHAVTNLALALYVVWGEHYHFWA